MADPNRRRPARPDPRHQHSPRERPRRIDAATRDELLHTLQGVLVGLSAITTRGTRPGENKARLLLEVFRDRPNDILRFVTDLAVPPTSNDAERGLRPSKVQQNVSGRLTSVARTKDRYRILGYVTTAAQHGHDKMTVIHDAVLNRPWGCPNSPHPPDRSNTPKPAGGH